MPPRFGPFRTFLGLDPSQNPLDNAFAALLPIPYDATASYRSGARFGPQALLDASVELELYDEELEAETAALGIHTLPPLEVDLQSPGAMVELVRQAMEALASPHRLLVGIGGEHSATVGLVRGLRSLYPQLSILYLDAHADFRSSYQGTPYSHACGLRRLWEDGYRGALVGVRSLSLEERQALETDGPWSLFAHAFSPGPPPMENLLEQLPEPVYLSIDLDVLDPAVLPNVGTPEPGGLTWQQLLDLLRTVTARRRVVGFDIMELCPEAGPPYGPFVAARLTYRLLGYVAQSWGLLPRGRSFDSMGQ